MRQGFLSIFLFEAQMWQSFVLLFKEMTAVVYIFYILGIVLCSVETIIPGFGVFGISGIASIIVAIIIRMAQGGDAFMAVYMVLIAVLVIVLMLLTFGNSIRKGILSRTKMFAVGTSVPEGRTEGTADHSHLLNKSGIAQTVLRPIGTGQFGEQTLDVISKSGIIDAGEKIKVVDVSGTNPVVVKITEKN